MVRAPSAMPPAPATFHTESAWSDADLDAKLTSMVREMVAAQGSTDEVTIPQEDAPMTTKVKLDPVTMERLLALKQRGVEGAAKHKDALAEALREAKAARREANTADERKEARAEIREAREEFKEARKDAREAQDALRDFERANGLREGALSEFFAGLVEGAVAKGLAALFEHLAALEGRVVEQLPGMVSSAVANAVGSIDFNVAVPGKVGAVIEAVDDQVLDVLSEVLGETMDDDGLTLDDVAGIASERLAQAGVRFAQHTLLGKINAMLSNE